MFGKVNYNTVLHQYPKQFIHCFGYLVFYWYLSIPLESLERKQKEGIPLTKNSSGYMINIVNYIRKGMLFMDLQWTDMVRYQQQIQKLTRSLLPVRQSILTASECELLASLYLDPEKNTPLLLSQKSGMKKEAVSRCLKSLYEKGCIRKQQQACDERSYQLFITETGLTELKKGYESILQPFYDLWRSAGEDFEHFLLYADKLAQHIEKGKEKTIDHEIL